MAAAARIAVVGAGFVADYYMTTLANHPDLALAGVWDRDEAALSRFVKHHGVTAYASHEALLADPAVTLVLNLTNPESHFTVSMAALEAGKHVYSEKPLAMTFGDAQTLVAEADRRGLTLAAAPATVLGDAATAVWRALAGGMIGRPRLIHAEMEDGPVFLEGWQRWTSRSGAPWPGRNEFAIGCTLEHAGYYLTWLCAFFGPARHVTATSHRLFDDKRSGQSADELAADYSVAVLGFDNGVKARLTCGLAAQPDRSFQIVGETGSLVVEDGWNNRSRVRLARPRAAPCGFGTRLRRSLVDRLNVSLPGRLWQGDALPLPAGSAMTPGHPSRIDFMRGPAEQARAIGTGRAPRLGGAFALHITELALGLQGAGPNGASFTPQSTFTPLQPP